MKSIYPEVERYSFQGESSGRNFPPDKSLIGKLLAYCSANAFSIKSDPHHVHERSEERQCDCSLSKGEGGGAYTGK
jgi:hypothetical protein